MAGLTCAVFDLTGQVEALPRTLAEMLTERDKGRDGLGKIGTVYGAVARIFFSTFASFTIRAEMLLEGRGPQAAARRSAPAPIQGSIFMSTFASRQVNGLAFVITALVFTFIVCALTF
jgi:hypothetical protein